jgi:hypothetical protein
METKRMTPKELKEYNPKLFERAHQQFAERQTDYGWWDGMYEDVTNSPQYYFDYVANQRPAEGTPRDDPAWAEWHAKVDKFAELLDNRTDRDFRVDGFDDYKVTVDNVDLKLFKMLEAGVFPIPEEHAFAMSILLAVIHNTQNTDDYVSLETDFSKTDVADKVYDYVVDGSQTSEDYVSNVLGVGTEDLIAHQEAVDEIKYTLARFAGWLADEVYDMLKGFASNVKDALDKELEWL